MSFLRAEIPSPRQALAALRKPVGKPSSGRRGGSGRSVVGLDIDSGYLTAVETAPGSVAVQKAAVAELPPDLVEEGEVVDPSGLAAVLKEFFAANHLGHRVRTGLASQRVVMRTVDLPPIEDEKQLASAIRFQAQEHIAMPLDQAVLEHHSLGLVGTADGPRSRVVLVAARKETVAGMLAALREAGLQVSGVDLSAFALIRAMYRPGDGEVPTAYINVGAGSNLAVASGTQALFTRVIPAGVESLVTDLAARRGLTREHARGWLRHVGLTAPLAGLEGDPDIVQSARDVLDDGVARIAADVRTTLDFYASQDGVITERAVLTGTGVALDGFADRFGAHLGLPAEVRVVPEASPGALEGVAAGQVTIAAGLTITEAPA